MATYHGVKFKTIFKAHIQPSFDQIEELIGWCNIFAEYELAPTYPGGSFGNLSVMTDNGMLLTSSGVDLGGKLTIADFVLVHDCNLDTFEMTATGIKEPSSETPVHFSLYKKRPEIRAIFHGHHQKMLDFSKYLDLDETSNEQPYGTPELVNEVLCLSSKNFILMKNHGFLSLAPSMQVAGEKTLEILSKINQMV